MTQRKPAAAPGGDGAVASVESRLRFATARLGPVAGDPATARIEAELLLAHCLGTTRAGLLAGSELSAAAARAFERLVDERASTARPVAYLTGRAVFGELELSVDERVLVPRPETELLVDVFAGKLAAGAVPPGPVVDVGTGSGAIALSVCDRRRVVAIDVSADALAVAGINVAACGASASVTLVRADGLSALAPGSLAAVLANPPYIDPDDLAGLPPDVREHEPRGALVPAFDLGNAGRLQRTSAMFARLIAEAHSVLRAGGWLLTEVGAGQASIVATDLVAAGYEDVETTTDLLGHERIVAGRVPMCADPR